MKESIINILDKFKKLLSKKEITKEDETVRLPREELMTMIDYTPYGSPDIINPENENTIFILDDIPETRDIYEVDFSVMERRYKKNPAKEFRIIHAVCPTAGPMAHNFIVNHAGSDNAGGKIRVDYAILDITLGYRIKIPNDGDVVEFDGVDIAIDLLKANPNTKIIFATAHLLKKGSPTMEYFYRKFEAATGKQLDEFYLYKNGDRPTAFAKLIYGITDDKR